MTPTATQLHQAPITSISQQHLQQSPLSSASQVQTVSRVRQHRSATSVGGGVGTVSTRSYKIEAVDDSIEDKHAGQIVIHTASAPTQTHTTVNAPAQPTLQQQQQQQMQHHHHHQSGQVQNQPHHQITTVNIPTASGTVAGTTAIVSHKRTAPRSSVSSGIVPHIKRSKSTTIEAVEGSDGSATTQQISVQGSMISGDVKNQIQQTTAVQATTETEYIEMPMSIDLPAKSEPDYADETAEIDHGEHDSTTYVEDESYAEMRYDETYFTENEDDGNISASTVVASSNVTPATVVTTIKTGSSNMSNSGAGGGATTSKNVVIKQQNTFSDSSYLDTTDQANNDSQGWLINFSQRNEIYKQYASRDLEQIFRLGA